MKSRNNTEKNIAQIAQKKLEDLILNKTIKLKNIKYDKYGRLLSDVYYNNKSISDMLLTERLAIPYFGKKKEPPLCWKKYYESGELK